MLDPPLKGEVQVTFINVPCNKVTGVIGWLGICAAKIETLDETDP